MWGLVQILAGLALLGVAYVLYERQKERNLVTRLKAARHNTEAAIAVIEQATEEERKRQEFWYRQNPGGGL